MANIGKNIRQIRTKKNMKQEELAEKLYVSRQTISNYETGKSRPDIDMILKIAEVLDTDVNALIYGDEVQEKQKRKWYLQLARIIGVVILGIILWKMDQRVNGIMNYTWSEDPNIDIKYHIAMQLRMFIDYGLYPLFSVIVGWQAMEVICLLFQKEHVKWKYADIVHRTTKGILCAYNIILLPFWIYEIRSTIDYCKWKLETEGVGYWSSFYDFLPVWDHIVVEIQDFGWEYSVVFISMFLALGALIRMTGRKGSKNETSLHEKI